MSLFRELDKEHPFSGTTLPEKVSFRYVIIACIFITGFSLFLLCVSTYTQRVKFKGIIYPLDGMTIIKSNSSGILFDLNKDNGKFISKGTSLFSIKANRSSAAYNDEEIEYEEEYNKLSSIYDKRKKDIIYNYNSQIQRVNEQINIINKNIELLSNRKGLIEDSLKTSRAAYNKIERAYSKKIVTLMDKNNIQQQYLDKVLQKENLYKEINDNINKISDLNHHKLDIENKMKEIKYDYMQNEVNNAIKKDQIYGKDDNIFLSPVSGMISSVEKHDGDQVQEGERIMTIIPDKFKPVALIFVPAEFIGRVKDNSETTIYIDSYPYQRFGTLYGKISDISKTPLSPDIIHNEYGIKCDTPAYKAIITLSAPKGQLRLIPEMSLKAAVPLETRTIIRWLYSSIFKNDTGFKLKNDK